MQAVPGVGAAPVYWLWMGACVSLRQVFYELRAAECTRRRPHAAAVRARRAAATGMHVCEGWGGSGGLTTHSYCPHGFGRGCARLAVWAGRPPSRDLHAPLVRLWR